MRIETRTAAVDVEEVEIFDIEDDGHDAQSIPTAGPFALLFPCLVQEQIVEMQQQTRFGAAAGDAVDVEMAAVGAEQIIEIDAAGTDVSRCRHS